MVRCVTDGNGEIRSDSAVVTSGLALETKGRKGG
jgi:hypothetical protein